MEDFIQTFLEDHIFTHKTKIPDNDIKHIYDLYHDGVIHENISINTMIYYGVYFETKNDHDNILKYYSLAIQKGSIDAMDNLASYYFRLEDWPNMTKYYLMAIENNYSASMNNLAKYYYNIDDYNNMIKYYLMAIDNGNSDAEEHLLDALSDITIMEKFIQIQIHNKKEISKLKEENNLLTTENNHFKYMPNGPGFMEAKKEFETMASHITK